MDKWENIVSLPPIVRSLCLIDDGLNNQKINESIQADSFLNDYLVKILHKQSDKFTIDSALNSYGHKGFRDKITSLYIYKIENDVFPDNFREDSIIELVDFENRFAEFESAASFRAYTLGYFLKVYNDQQFKNDLDEIIPSIEVDQILSLGKIKSNRIDWIILVLSLCLEKINKEQIIKHLNLQNIDVYSILKLLDPKDLDRAFSIILLYAHSINDKEMFSFKRV